MKGMPMQTNSINFSKLKKATVLLMILMVLIIPVQIIVYVISPPPQSVSEIYRLYQENPLAGLVSMDLLLLFNNIILIFLYTTLFLMLVREQTSFVILGMIFEIIGLAVYFPTNPAFEMLKLSRLFLKAEKAEQIIYLAAGEGMMASYVGTAYITYYLFNGFALLLFSYSVMKSSQFDRITGIWGLIAGILMLVPPTVGTVGMIFSFLSLFPWVIFVIRLCLPIWKSSVAKG